MRHGHHTRGLVLPEVLAAAGVVVVLAALLVVATSESRRQASLRDNFANLKQFALGTSAYGADNADRVWGFSWRAGVDYGYGGVAENNLQAAANQAVEIIRRRGNRPDIGVISGWTPHVSFSHLVLLDYLDTLLPERFVVAPEDHQRLRWQQSIVPDPMGFFSLLSGIERPEGFSNALKRWPYISSYEIPPAFYAPDARTLNPTTPTFAQGTTHNQYYTGAWNMPLGGRRLAEIAFPSQKIMIFEQYERHFGPRQAFFAYPSARVPAMLADGSVRVVRTGDTGRGFSPNSPLSSSAHTFSYTPARWEPRTLSSFASDIVTGYYRWTRSGLRGRDFGGPEVPWVD